MQWFDSKKPSSCITTFQSRRSGAHRSPRHCQDKDVAARKSVLPFHRQVSGRKSQDVFPMPSSNYRSLDKPRTSGHDETTRPLLFLLYINDLPNCLKHSHPRMFADDTHLTYSAANVHDIDQNLNQDLKSVSEWLAANKLTLNTSKTEFMLIGSRQRIRTFHSSPTLTINETPIKRVDCVKSLGLNIDENLSWNKHIDKISKKIASGIGALKRMRPFVPSSTLKYIYSSIIQPHFDYCCVVWDNCSKSSADKLQKLQNRAARILTFSSYDTNADLLIKRLGWRKLDSQRKIQKVTMVYKSLNGLNPDYLQPLFNYCNSVINYTLRDTEGKLTIPMPRTNYLKNSFGYSGAELWNNLPIHVRQAVTLKQFKAGCSSYFI